MKKVIRLNESDLVNLVKQVIEEQKKFQLNILPGSQAQGKLQNDVLTIETESGKTQKFKVKTSLPQGKFMFLYGKDGKYYGTDPKTKRKTEILLQQKL
jgi:hypothetical protein